jgi:hypothetical protein
MTDAELTFQVDEIIEYNEQGSWWPGIIGRTNDTSCGGAYLIFTAVPDSNGKLRQCYTHRDLRKSIHRNLYKEDSSYNQIRKYTGINPDVVSFIRPIWLEYEKEKVEKPWKQYGLSKEEYDARNAKAMESLRNAWADAGKLNKEGTIL